MAYRPKRIHICSMEVCSRLWKKSLFESSNLIRIFHQTILNLDFVDRGSFSVECILTLLGFKLLYPNHFHMTRGNHESQTMNQIYGFEGEIRGMWSCVCVC